MLRKEQLFISKDLKQWDLPEEVVNKHSAEKLLSNRAPALQNMLPRESRELEETLKGLGYYSNKLQEEITRVNSNNYFVMRDHFKRAAEGSSKQYGMVRDSRLLEDEPNVGGHCHPLQ